MTWFWTKSCRLAKLEREMNPACLGAAFTTTLRGPLCRGERGQAQRERRGLPARSPHTRSHQSPAFLQLMTFNSETPRVLLSCASNKQTQLLWVEFLSPSQKEQLLHSLFCLLVPALSFWNSLPTKGSLAPSNSCFHVSGYTIPFLRSPQGAT